MAKIKRPRIGSSVNSRIFNLLCAIHSEDKKTAYRRFKMYKLRYELAEA